MKRVVVLFTILLMLGGCQKVASISLDVHGYPHRLPPDYSLKCDGRGHYLSVRGGLQITPYYGRYHYSKEAAYIRAWDQYRFENRGYISPTQDNWPVCEEAPKD